MLQVGISVLSEFDPQYFDSISLSKYLFAIIINSHWTSQYCIFSFNNNDFYCLMTFSFQNARCPTSLIDKSYLQFSKKRQTGMIDQMLQSFFSKRQKHIFDKEVMKSRFKSLQLLT